MSFDMPGMDSKIYLSESQIDQYLSIIQPNYNSDEIDFEVFARLVAIILEITQFENQDN